MSPDLPRALYSTFSKVKHVIAARTDLSPEFIRNIILALRTQEISPLSGDEPQNHLKNNK